MSLTIRYEATQTVLSSIGSNAIRFGGLALQQSAQVGEPAISENGWDDDAAAWELQGYREFWLNETSAPVNDQVVYNGFILSRTITRGASERTTSARQINVETADGNVALGWRILYDGSGSNSANRPAETAGDRIRWLVNSSGVLPSLYAHPTYFANPTTAMDANDYRGQRYNDVLGDVANVTGYNFWVQWSEVRARSELLFIDPNGSDYASTLRISNDLTDVTANHNTTGLVFAPSEDAELHVDPSRIAADVYLPYDGGAVFVTRSSTAATFARVDQAAPNANVKTSAKATALANRYLDDNDEEDERVGCSIVVPASQVNDLRQGMLTYAKFTHFPNWENFRPCRVLTRTVIQSEEIGQGAYRIDLELSPTTSPGAETVITTLNLAMCNTVLEDAARDGTDTATGITFTSGEVWRYTISNTGHASAAFTDKLALNYAGTTPITAATIVRAWGISAYWTGGAYPIGTPTNAPDQGVGASHSAFASDTGTFVVSISGTGRFLFYAGANYEAVPVSRDECWSCTLERLS